MGFPLFENLSDQGVLATPEAYRSLHRRPSSLSVPRHDPPKRLIVLDLTFCQRNDDLAIAISARPCTEAFSSAPRPSVYPFLPLSPVVATERGKHIDFKTYSDERCQRDRPTPRKRREVGAWPLIGDDFGEADGIESTTSSACKAVGALLTELCPSVLSFRSARSHFIWEVIQPQVPLRLPCYDLVPIRKSVLRAAPCGWPSDFGRPSLSWLDGRCVQGSGTHSPRCC